jgi:hypothetical protein
LPTFVRLLTAGREPNASSQLRVVLQEQHPGAKKSLGEYPLTFDFENLARITTRGPKKVDVEFQKQEVKITNAVLPWSVRLARVYNAEEVAAVTGPYRSVKPKESDTFKFALAHSEPERLTADVKLDLTGKHPFELFSLGFREPRILTAKLTGVWSARFPSEGAVGTGRYVDLRRSKFTILFSNGDQNQRFPGPEMTFERLSQLYPDWVYQYPIYGSYTSEIVLELYPLGDDKASPTKLTLPLPYNEDGQPRDLMNLDLQRAQLLLSEAAGKTSQPETGDGRPDR